METPVNYNNKEKMKGDAKSSSKHSMRSLDEVIDSESDLVEDIGDFVESEKAMFRDEVHQVSKLMGFVKAHWKAVVPTVAIIGVGAFLIRGNKPQVRKSTRR